MSKKASAAKQIETVYNFAGALVGTVEHIDEHGVAWVNFAGNPEPAAVQARSTLEAPSPLAAADALVGAQVLLVFEDADPRLPIVTGVVRERLQPKPTVPVMTLDKNTVRDVLVDGRQLVFSAQQQIVLRCGKSSVTLRRDGKVVVKGADLLSRSSGPNKIKGASIDLN
ncbi:MAG: hypothetical protein RL701_5214 [Pseudomonadota bacterium]